MAGTFAFKWIKCTKPTSKMLSALFLNEWSETVQGDKTDKDERKSEGGLGKSQCDENTKMQSRYILKRRAVG